MITLYPPILFFRKNFSRVREQAGEKTKAAEALGFRGLRLSLSHLWGHSSGNI
jgi:hypothetical protein